jgi:hypothetical protein
LSTRRMSVNARTSPMRRAETGSDVRIEDALRAAADDQPVRMASWVNLI